MPARMPHPIQIGAPDEEARQIQHAGPPINARPNGRRNTGANEREPPRKPSGKGRAAAGLFLTRELPRSRCIRPAHPSFGPRVPEPGDELAIMLFDAAPKAL